VLPTFFYALFPLLTTKLPISYPRMQLSKPYPR
jgi:hypothetical protein